MSLVGNFLEEISSKWLFFGLFSDIIFVERTPAVCRAFVEGFDASSGILGLPVFFYFFEISIDFFSGIGYTTIGSRCVAPAILCRIGHICYYFFTLIVL